MLSIVIPVYKVEATLERCVRSVLDQSYVDFELILVDDGSPDGCPAMCDAFASADSRVRVVHKPNGGLSSARNAGIDVAAGSLIMFVDSDDYIMPGTLEAAVQAMDAGIDMVEFPVMERVGSPRCSRLDFERRDYDSTDDYWFQTKAYGHAYAWNKVYRRHLFHAVRFPEGKVFEDVATLPKLLRCAGRVRTIADGMYMYCWNGSGITALAGGKEIAQQLEAHLDNWPDVADDDFYAYLLNIQLDVCRLTRNPPVLPPRRVWSLKRYTAVMAAKLMIQNILGLKNLCRINKLLQTILRRY